MSTLYLTKTESALKSKQWSICRILVNIRDITFMPHIRPGVIFIQSFYNSFEKHDFTERIHTVKSCRSEWLVIMYFRLSKLRFQQSLTVDRPLFRALQLEFHNKVKHFQVSNKSITVGIFAGNISINLMDNMAVHSQKQRNKDQTNSRLFLWLMILENVVLSKACSQVL